MSAATLVCYLGVSGSEAGAVATDPDPYVAEVNREDVMFQMAQMWRGGCHWCWKSAARTSPSLEPTHGSARSHRPKFSGRVQAASPSQLQPNHRPGNGCTPVRTSLFGSVKVILTLWT